MSSTVMTPSNSRPRFFNTIEYSGNTVKKTIFDKKRGNEEVYFYKNLPKNEKIFFPKIKKISHGNTGVSYEMEFIAKYDISQIYLRQTLTKEKLRALLNAIDDYWNHVQIQHVTHQKWNRAAKKVILDRMDVRWKAYTKMPIYSELQRSFKQTYHLDINQIKNAIKKDILKALKSSKEALLYRTHGDLCFSNIFLINNKQIKFIDPRGGLTKQDLFIPLIYDIAKLSQCIYGNYDGIVGNKKISFSSQMRVFTNWLNAKNISLKTLRLVESSHFLSLLPLHADQPQKHYAFLKAAVTAYQDALCHP